MAEKVLFRSQRFAVHKVESQLADGSSFFKEVIRQPGGVVILPVLDDGRVVMIRNHRLTIGQTLLELPAGTMEAGESPATTAARELTEETGYTAEKLEFVQSFFAAPGNCDEEMFLFIASGLQAGDPRREPGEQIENELLGWDEIDRMLKDGEIRDAKTLIGLLRYKGITGR